MNRLALPAVLLSLALVACDSSDKSSDTEDDVPTSTDTDSTDTESSDTEEPAGDFTVAGEGSYFSSLAGETVCDREFTLSGEAYTGDCNDCDLAFTVEPTATSDDSSADCSAPWKWNFELDPYYYEYSFYLAFSESGEIFDYYTYDYTDVTNVMQWGYGLDGDFASWIYTYHYDESDYGSVSWDGSELEWTYDNAYDDYAFNEAYGDSYYFAYRSYFYASSYADSLYSSDYSDTSSVDCDGLLIDVWDMDLTSGDSVGISVDTVADDSAFDPWLIVRDPSGETLYFEDDSFDCTYEPAAYQCPASSVAVDTTGTYQVLVGSYGSCNGDEASYSLSVDAGGDPGLSLSTDDGALYTTEAVVVSASGKLTVTME